METLTPVPPERPDAPRDTPPAAKPGARGVAGNAIRQLLPLVIVLFAVKWYVADIRVIPSGSMEPTLHGRAYCGDRILFRHFFGGRPARWDVFVFKFPYEEAVQRGGNPGALQAYRGEDFIKRCVGLPGEDLAIVNGDIFIRSRPGETAVRQVKPDSLQRHLWLPVYRGDFTRPAPGEFAAFWDGGAAPEVSADGETLKITAENPVVLGFAPRDRGGRTGSVLDRYIRRHAVTYTCPACRHQTRQSVTRPQMSARCGHCGRLLTESDVTYYGYFPGYPRPEMPPLSMFREDDPAHPKARDAWHRVRDLRWKARMRFLRPGTALTVELLDDGTVTAAEFRAAENGQGVVTLRRDGREIPGGRAAFTLAPGAWGEVEFYRCDGEFRAFLDEKPLCSAAPEGHAIPAARHECQSSGARFAVRGAAEFREIAIDRDIHYFARGGMSQFTHIPADGYMAMGDNCPASNDSRDWGPVPEKNLVGKAVAVWWPLDAARIIH